MASTFHFTIAQSASIKDDYQSLQNTPEGFVQQLIKRGHLVGPKDGTAVILATFREGARLEQKNVQEVTGLALDFDGKYKIDGKTVLERVDVDALLAKLPFKGVAHSSYSHTSAFPKFRVLLPLAEPISMNDHRRLWWWFYELTERKADPSGKNPDRLFFLPRAPDESAKADAWIRPLDGPLLSMSVVPADYQPPESTPIERAVKRQGAHRAPAEARRAYRPADATLLLEKLEELPIIQWAMEHPADVSREAWRGIATNIAAAVLEDESMHDAGAELFHKVSEPDPSRYDWTVTQKTFKDALRSAAQYGPMTFQHLLLNGVPEAACQDLGTGAKSPLGLVRMMIRPGDRAAHPKVQAPTPTAAPVESGAAPDYSQPSTSPEPKPQELSCESKASETSSNEPKKMPASPTPSSTPSSPSSEAASSDEEGEGGDTIFKHNPDEYLYDKERSKWMSKDEDNEWHDMDEAAFSMHLSGLGLPRKKQEGWKAKVPQFLYRKPVWTQPGVELVYGPKDNIFNTYKPTKLEPKPGAWDHIRALILNLCGGDAKGAEFVLDWLARPVQELHKKDQTGKRIGGPYKLGTALVFHGAPGSGKGTLGNIMEAIYGDANVVTIGQNELDNRFNGELLDKLFVVANEVVSSTNRSMETANKVKPWITDPMISIEQKFQGSRLVKNNFNIMFTSNDDRPVIVERGDRRYTVFRSERFDPAMASKIYDDLLGPQIEVAAFFDHLLTRNTVIKYGDLYISKAREAMMLASMHSDERFVQSILEDGWLAVSYDWVDSAQNGKVREAFVTVEGENFILSSTLKEVYNDYCRRNNMRSRGQSRLGQTLTETHNIQPVKIRYGNVQHRAWKGIPLRGPDEVVVDLEARKKERQEKTEPPKTSNNIEV